MQYNKKIFIVMFSVFIIAVLVSFSYVHFVKNDVKNALSSINIVTKSEGDFTNTLTTTFFEGNHIIEIDNIEVAGYENIHKFSITAEASEAINARIRWNNVFTNINIVNSEYNLYRCSESNYTTATYEDVSELCISIGRTTYNTLPTTREQGLATLAVYESIPANTTYYYVLKLNITNNVGKCFYANIDVDFSQEYYTLSEAILNAYAPQSDENIAFEIVSSESGTNGLYSNDKENIPDDPTLGTIKYFRGAVNNYVIFAGLTWRVIRINPGGFVRIITHDTIFSNRQFNSASIGSKYVGYTWDRSDDANNASSIKVSLDGWYADYLSSHTSYINQTAEYCNDTSGSTTRFGSAIRLPYSVVNTPTFSCPTSSYNYGGVYRLPIATITADEVSYAGSTLLSANATYYLNNGTEFWTISPAHADGSQSVATELYVNSDGALSYTNLILSKGYRAVIELNPNTLVTGQGTSTSPWVVQ